MTGKRENTLSARSIKGIDAAAAVKSLLKSSALMAVLAYLFYRSVWAFAALIPVDLYLAHVFMRSEQKRRKDRMAAQFREGILALAASVKAGHSAENAFADAAAQLKLLYGADARMTKEFERVTLRIRSGVTLEQAVAEMAKRCDIADITTFAEVFAVSRRTGGEIGRLIADTAQTIGERIEVREDINTMLRGRKYESDIMKVLPLFIIIYLDVTSPGYFTVLYSTMAGRIIMTVCLGLYVVSWYMTDKIMAIDV